ncbi:MAG TPA: hypothetical protein VI914_05890 [Thermodesulfobacteriota bacterium]|nr:hypothetical protein [Thermodesulfobacteriota bacterium]
MKQQFLEDTADTFKTYIYENNRRIVPSSATLTVYKPGGDSILVDAQSMTVGAGGLLSYSLTTAHNDAANENYKAVISYIYNSATWYLTFFYDVVKSKLSRVITDDDIINELPQLKDKGWRVHGTADSGSTTTIVDAELKRYEDDYFTGGLAYSINKGETKEITDFVSSTGTVTTTAFSSAIAADKYILTRPFSREIQRAFEKIEELLNSAGKRPFLILDPYDLREVNIYYSVAEVCKGLATEGDSLWWNLWKDYENKAYAIFKGINFKYDQSNDGYIAGSEESKRMNTLKAGRS